MSHHLGKTLYPLLDGRLGRAESLEAMAHLESCDACTRRWADLRRDREALRTSGSGIDMRFAQKLLNRDRIAEIAGAEPRRHAKVARGVRPHVLRATLVSAAGASVLLAMLYALGEPTVVGPDALLAGASFNGMDVQVAPSGDFAHTPLEPWVHPVWGEGTVAPSSAIVIEANGMRFVQAVIIVNRDVLTITEARGRLPEVPRAPFVRDDHRERDVFVFVGDQSTVLFQSEDRVVRIDCLCPLDALLAVADSFPEGSTPGVFQRLGEGVGHVADAVTGG